LQRRDARSTQEQTSCHHTHFIAEGLAVCTANLMQVAGLEQWWNVNVQVCCSAAKYKMQAANAVQA